ncbi:MAG: DUF2752 domain-containing protein [Oscillospiraceae bacterium]|nr:DUF2752 domain-containing protein [Oscillospiraceae bacterium]
MICISIFLIICNIYIKFSNILRIPCFLYASTGYLCPGCGATRCIKALLKGNIFRAFINNPIIFLLIVFIILIYIKLFCRTFLSKDKKIIPESKYFYIALSGIILIYCILRNFIPYIQPTCLFLCLLR